MKGRSRANLAKDILQYYAGTSKPLSDEDVIDLMADILHYACLEGMDIEAVLRMAEAHFITEKDQ